MANHIDNAEFRQTLFSAMIDNTEFSKEIMPYIKPEYFQSMSEYVLWDVFQKYNQQYKKVPSRSILRVGIEKSSKLSGIEKLEAKSLINQKNDTEDLEWLKDKTEEWCKLRACYNAVIESMTIIDGDSSQEMETLPSLLTDAVAVNFDKRIGTDYLLSAEERWELYHDKIVTIPTGVDHFDDMLGGGYPLKSLIVFLAPTGVGKSLVMCSSAAHALKGGYNVLYITMEMSEEKIAQRIDSNIMDLDSKDLLKLTKNKYVSEFEKMKESTMGKLIIKEYGTGSASITNFNALIQELNMKQDFVPNIIFIDYLNICGSSRAGKGVNSYEKVKYIAEELRSVAMENNVPVVTATQANREGINSSDLDLTNTSESIGLPQTADAMIALTATDEMRNNGLMKTIKLKNRFGDPTYKKVHMIGVDYPKMKVFDLPDQPAHINAMNADLQQTTQTKKTALPMGKASKDEIDWS